MKPLFEFGRVQATPGALALLEANGEEAVTYIRRHLSGDWGTGRRYESTTLTPEEHAGGAVATSDDAKLNLHALRYGGRILSAYDTPGGRLWVITDGLDAGGRASADTYTTVLLPEEY